MKPLVLVPPVVALAVAGFWLGQQRRTIDRFETDNAALTRRIADARKEDATNAAGPGARPKTEKSAEGPIDWKSLAEKLKDMNGRNGGVPDMRAMMQLQQRLLGMSAAALFAELDVIAGLDLSDEERRGLENMLVGVLVNKDPEGVLKRFEDRLRAGQGYDPMSWQLTQAFNRWAGKDAAAAAVWLDERIAAGKFDSKSLDGRNQMRQQFEAALMMKLVASDPAAAGARLDAMPEQQRLEVFQGGFFAQMEPGSEAALAKLAREHLPADQRTIALTGPVGMLVQQGGYERVGEYLKGIGASAAEREEIVKAAVGSRMSHAGDPEKVVEEIDKARTWAGAESPDSVDKLTGAAIGQYALQKDFNQALELAESYQQKGGGDEVIAGLLESPAAINNRDTALTLLDRIQDPVRREELRKKLEAYPGGNAGAPAQVVPTN